MLKKFPLKTKKLLAVLVAVSVIGTASVSDAWVGAAIRVIAAAWKVCPPEVKAQIASAAVHVGVFVAGALMYSLKPSGDGSHKGDANNIKRTSEVTWVDLADGKTVKQTDVTGKVSTNAVMNGAKENSTKYPQLNAATKTLDILNVNTIDPNNPGSAAGKFVKNNAGATIRLGTFSHKSGPAWGSVPVEGVTFWDGSYWAVRAGGGSRQVYNQYSQKYETEYASYTYWYRNNAEPGEPQMRDTTSQEFIDKLKNGAPENVYSDYYGEIDDFIKSNPNVVHFVDPTDETTPAVPDYASLSKQAAVAAAENTESAKAAADSAQSAATNARARANADPNNAALANAADRAEVAALAAKQKLDEAYAAEKKAEVEAEKEDGAKSSVGSDGNHDAYGVTGEMDFGTRISSFINNIRNSALFSLPSRILGDVPGGGSPVMSINMGTRFGTHQLDWSKFDPVWTVLRAVFLICMGVACVKIVTRGGAG